MSAEPPRPAVQQGPFDCEHALLLQGPAGPFMRRFALELQAMGIRTTKVNFHAGDVLFYPGPDAVAFTGDRERWPDFLRELIGRRGVDALFVYGDCRPLHRLAIEVARELGIMVWAFEEGYLRPDWITLERDGVNGHSKLPRDPRAYLEAELPEPEPPVPVPQKAFGVSGWYSTYNALAFTLLNRGFPRYEHHRRLNAWYQTYCWVRGAARKLYFERLEAGQQARFETELSGRYFFVPLQVHCDFQLKHSPYEALEDFMEEVVAEFARHADPTHHLLLKHHPMDRPYRDYGRFMRRLAGTYGLEGRLHYVHDLHLPTLLKHARGTITINSTVGLSSVHHRTPVKVMGTAVYDLPGLTHQGDIASFLAEPTAPDPDLYEAFRRYLLHHNQANGNVYVRLPGHSEGTGIRWSPTMVRRI